MVFETSLCFERTKPQHCFLYCFNILYLYLVLEVVYLPEVHLWKSRCIFTLGAQLLTQISVWFIFMPPVTETSFWNSPRSCLWMFYWLDMQVGNQRLEPETKGYESLTYTVSLLNYNSKNRDIAIIRIGTCKIFTIRYNYNISFTIQYPNVIYVRKLPVTWCLGSGFPGTTLCSTSYD